MTTSLALLCASLSAFGQQSGHTLKDYLGPKFSPTTKTQSQRSGPTSSNAALMVRHWNEMALNATGLDHTPVAPGDTRVFGEQLGPTRASRAMAITHIAMFDSVNAITGDYRSYTHLQGANHDASMDAAIAQSAHDTLAALYPSQKTTFDQELANDLNQISPSQSKNEGIQIGQRAATAILALRSNDGSQVAEPRIGIEFLPSDQPGKWRQDPIGQSPIALGAYWGNVTPFVLHSATQFRARTPPALTGPGYAAAFNTVKAVGGDGVVTPSTRTAEQTEIGIFWAYDGTPSLCAPPRLYNQITMHIADQMGTTADPVELARLLALVNVSMADTAITLWESKYFYQYWRPVAGIRESDPGTGPTGLGDGNASTTGVPNFTPLGAPASNLTGPNFTPPFPSYPSGHAGFGGALFQTLRNFYGSNNIAFTFTSDEFNGTTRDNQGNLRPLMPRSFSSLSQAEDENGQSRIYLGIHWIFDKTEGIAQGERVANFVFTNAFTRRQHGSTGN